MRDPGQTRLDREYQKIAENLGRDFCSYDSAKADETVFHPTPDNTALTIIDDVDRDDYRRISFLSEIWAIKEGEQDEVIFPLSFIQCFTREEIVRMEAEWGIVIAGISKKHPDGGIFIKDAFSSSLEDIHEASEIDQARINTVESIYATGALHGVAKLITQKPTDKIPEDLKGLPSIAVNTISIAVNDGHNWGGTHVLPYGEYVVRGFDNGAFQYGQSAFEGLVANKNDEDCPSVRGEVVVVAAKKGKVTVFRPEENAMRFINSCKQLSIPPISVTQFVQAVISAVQNNLEFIAKGGKLYIRPFVVGLEGGTGVKPAKKYLFAVEVSPYGEYMAKSGESTESQVIKGINVKCIVLDRPAFARAKVSGSYAAQIFKEKETAKQETIEGTDEKFDDILLISKKNTIQENGSSNFWLVAKGVKGNREKIFRVYTPSLQENILPGITRDSLITLIGDEQIQKRLSAKFAGAKIEILDSSLLAESSIHQVSGAFSSGTAAGITNIKRIQTSSSYVGNKFLKNFKDPETYDFIRELGAILQEARRGEIPGYEHWAMEIPPPVTRSS